MFVDSQSDVEAMSVGQSLASSDAGDTEEWGQGAILEWDGVWDSEEVEHVDRLDHADNGNEDDDHDDDEGEEIHDIDAISDDDLPSRGSTLPLYSEWDTAKLQVSFNISAVLIPEISQTLRIPRNLRPPRPCQDRDRLLECNAFKYNRKDLKQDQRQNHSYRRQGRHQGQ